MVGDLVSRKNFLQISFFSPALAWHGLSYKAFLDVIFSTKQRRHVFTFGTISYFHVVKFFFLPIDHIQSCIFHSKPKIK